MNDDLSLLREHFRHDSEKAFAAFAAQPEIETNNAASSGVDENLLVLSRQCS